MALVGLMAFYGLERAAKLSRGNRRRASGADATGVGVFWLHAGSFAIYNALIGYLLLHREEPGLWSLALFAFAMEVHFVVNDSGLREDHKGAYDRYGRWVLAAAVLAGWVVGLLSEVSEAALAVLFAFLAGGVVMNAPRALTAHPCKNPSSEGSARSRLTCALVDVAAVVVVVATNQSVSLDLCQKRSLASTLT